MKKSTAVICCSVFFSLGCSNSASSPQQLKAGTGITVDPATETISVDQTVVPTNANCSAGQLVQRSASGWTCVHSATDFLGSTATATNSSTLNGHPDSFFLPATGTAANSSQLGGLPAANYARADVATAMQGTLVIKNGSDPGQLSLGGTNSGLLGSNGSGNLHLDADSAKVDGHIYLNWFNGRGVRFGSGAQTQVAQIDTTGALTAAKVTSSGTIVASGEISTAAGVSASADISAASFNGLQVFLITFAAANNACKDGCLNNGASCLAAKSSPNGTIFGAAQCTDVLPPGFTFKCYCGRF
jgi:hypothetical protein